MKRYLATVWRNLGLSKKAQLTVMRATQDKFLIGVTGIIFNDKDEVLLFEHTYRRVPWSLPGGYLKAKEYPKEGLAREIEEETGFVVSIDRRLKIRTDRETARIDICYVGTFIGGEFKKNHEVSSAKFFSFDALPIIRKDQVLLIKEALAKRRVRQELHKPKMFIERAKLFFNR